jgi:hypothetical protein
MEASVPAYIDFKALAEAIHIERVAKHIGLTPKLSGKELRSACPACNSNDERALQILPETNSYRCYAAQQSGDCISLYAHLKGIGMYKAAKELSELFATPNGARNNSPTTPPQKSEGRTAKAQPAPFDPAAFAAKLVWSPEVEALGIIEEDATTLAIGFHPQRKRVYFPIRHTDGSIAGFIGYADGKLVMPPRWQGSKVVPLKRRA